MLKGILLSMIAFALLVHAYTRTTNVTTGGADFPALNASPTSFIPVTFEIPASVHVHFTLLYAATLGRDSSPTPVACHYAVRTGSETEYSVALHEYWKADPLDLMLQNRSPNVPGHSKDISIYSARIPVDRYEAGRCHWQFDKLVFWLENGSVKPTPVFHLANDINGVTSSVFRFLCAKLGATREAREQELCAGPRIEYATWLYESLGARNSFFNDPQAYVRSEAVAAGSTVSVEFHDIDNVVQVPPSDKFISGDRESLKDEKFGRIPR